MKIGDDKRLEEHKKLEKPGRGSSSGEGGHDHSAVIAAQDEALNSCLRWECFSILMTFGMVLLPVFFLVVTFFSKVIHH